MLISINSWSYSSYDCRMHVGCPLSSRMLKHISLEKDSQSPSAEYKCDFHPLFPGPCIKVVPVEGGGKQWQRFSLLLLCDRVRERQREHKKEAFLLRCSCSVPSQSQAEEANVQDKPDRDSERAARFGESRYQHQTSLDRLSNNAVVISIRSHFKVRAMFAGLEAS